MKSLSFVWPFIALILLVQTISVRAQNQADSAAELGLELAWTSQAQLPLAGRGIVSTGLWLVPGSSRSFAEVELAGRVFTVAADQLDENNHPLGIDKAKTVALANASRAGGGSEGLEVAEVSVPEILLVIATSDGLVQCLNAETGTIHWSAPCGPVSAPAYPAALSTEGVVLIQGQQLYLLDWLTGKLLLDKRLPTATSNAVGVAEFTVAAENTSAGNPAEINSYAFVLDYAGGVTGFGLSESISPWGFKLAGRAVAAPVSLTDRSRVAVATDHGWLYVFSASPTPAVSFRYESGTGFGGSPAAGNNAFYIGDLAGAITKISTVDRGEIVWKYRMTQSITAQPLVHQPLGLVFVCSDSGELIAIDDSTGYPAWDKSAYGRVRVRAPLAIIDGRVICRTASATFASYDARTGQLLGETSPMKLANGNVVNDISDRLYIIGTDGRIQCYRSTERKLPRLLGSEEPTGKPPATFKQPSRSASSSIDATVADQDSEIGLSDDPFSEPPTPTATEDADPFGAPASEADAPTEDAPADSNPF